MNSFPDFNSHDLLLRKITDADIGHIFLGLSDPRVVKYYGVSFTTLEATRQQMEWYLELQREQTGFWWAICSADNTSFFGACGFNNLSKEHRKAEIGFWLLPEYWGQGLISKALPLIINSALNEHNLHRIEAYVETENQASKKVLKKMGFHHEGTLRECERKNGEWISLDIFALLRE